MKKVLFACVWALLSFITVSAEAAVDMGNL